MNNISEISRERIAMFIDYHNLELSLRNEALQVDFGLLINYLAEGRRLIECFAYVGFNPQRPDPDEAFHQSLRTNGVIVRTKKAKIKPDGKLKCDFDVEMTLGVVDFVSNFKPDTIVLLTGDGDFVPLVHWLRMRGIRVEVGGIASSMSQDLLEAANDYIDLQSAIEEIKAGLEMPEEGRR